MAVQNSLARQRKPEAKPQTTTYMANGQQVELSPEIVKRYLISGDADRVTTQEIVMFINLCKFNGLNPWLKEAYCIKYGNSPATIVPAKDAFKKRADTDPAYDGESAGIIVLNPDGQVERREGCFILEGESLVGGWAKVWRKDRSHPHVAEVSLTEYQGRKKDGTVNSQWSGKPATMIRKVALTQALREAFPAKLGALYMAEEQGAQEPVYAIDYEATYEGGDQPTQPAPIPEAAGTDDFFDDHKEG
ncbi:phage recombination protein Bet [Allofournierella sp.]|uniref:phage recombination protein Bet n=1 Tax=Allofournierella sp. TaxID=1940256 RepID=UPI003AB66C6A